ncbi:DUF420 domain-containing protein [Sphingobacterium sp. Mn56C]|uniref:DUF420 domain-containing protein n=1 Tax=Sphingobacterium sp. Mn56C TaxID=3395261 RepID=UPI003BE77EE2
MQARHYSTPIWILTLSINGLIILAYYLPEIPALQHYDFSGLPRFNAILNGLTFCALLSAFYTIRRKNIALHRTFIGLAFFFTSLFLFSYLCYHFSSSSTSYAAGGTIRIVYFTVLISHIILAGIIVPLALLTMALALNRDFQRHRKLARWTLPIWLYVSLSGVIVYLMIAPYYPH